VGWADSGVSSALWDKAEDKVQKGVSLGTRAVATPILRPLTSAAAGAVTATGGLVAKGVSSLAKGAVSFAHRNPLQAAVGAAVTPFAAKALKNAPTTSNPRTSAAARGMYEQASHMMSKRSSMNVISSEDLRAYLRTRRGLEKSASAVRQTGREALEEALQKAVKAGIDIGKKQGDKSTAVLGGGYGVKQVLLAGMALGAGGAIAGAGNQAVGFASGQGADAVHRLGRNRHFNAMMKADPNLRQLPSGEVRQAFALIHKASPYVAKEPLLAASTVHSIVSTPREFHGSKTPNVSLDAIRKVLDVESSRQGTRYPFMQELKGRPDANTGAKAVELLG
jgi:hypothetical protein